VRRAELRIHLERLAVTGDRLIGLLPPFLAEAQRQPDRRVARLELGGLIQLFDGLVRVARSIQGTGQRDPRSGVRFVQTCGRLERLAGAPRVAVGQQADPQLQPEIVPPAVTPDLAQKLRKGRQPLAVQLHPENIGELCRPATPQHFKQIRHRLPLIL